MSKHREPKAGKNPYHGNNTLIVNVPETFTLGGGRWHGRRCGLCESFPCDKTPRPEQDYCAYYPSRFRLSVEGQAQ